MSIPTELSLWAWSFLAVGIVMWLRNTVNNAKEFNIIKRDGDPDPPYFSTTGLWGIRKGQHTNRTCDAHERVHLYTAATWFVSVFQAFGWVLFYERFGLIWSVLVNIIAHRILVRLPLETVADIGATVVVGPKRFVKDMSDLYRKSIDGIEDVLGGGWVFISFMVIVGIWEAISYPFWRIPIFISAVVQRIGVYRRNRRQSIWEQTMFHLDTRIQEEEKILATSKNPQEIGDAVVMIQNLLSRREALLKIRENPPEGFNPS